jgi:hypothetical protein
MAQKTEKRDRVSENEQKSAAAVRDFLISHASLSAAAIALGAAEEGTQGTG